VRASTKQIPATYSSSPLLLFSPQSTWPSNLACRPSIPSIPSKPSKSLRYPIPIPRSHRTARTATQVGDLFNVKSLPSNYSQHFPRTLGTIPEITRYLTRYILTKYTEQRGLPWHLAGTGQRARVAFHISTSYGGRISSSTVP
jgi:hypothetical protein